MNLHKNSVVLSPYKNCKDNLFNITSRKKEKKTEDSFQFSTHIYGEMQFDYFFKFVTVGLRW